MGGYGGLWGREGRRVSSELIPCRSHPILRYPISFLYGRYAAKKLKQEQGACSALRSFDMFAVGCTFVTWLAIMCRLLVVFNRSKIPVRCRTVMHMLGCVALRPVIVCLAMLGAGRAEWWRRLCLWNEPARVHDTPRTVWLQTMLNVSFGYIFIFALAFSPNIVYANANLPAGWFFTYRWPESLLYWAPYNLRGFFDAIFTFVAAKRLILDQAFIADLFGLPGEWEWLRDDFEEDLHDYMANHEKR